MLLKENEKFLRIYAPKAEFDDFTSLFSYCLYSSLSILYTQFYSCHCAINSSQQTVIELEIKRIAISLRALDVPLNQRIKLNADGYHTSPTHQRTPLVPRDLGEDFNLDCDDEISRPLDSRKPKNAKTSLFIVTSLVYALLLIVICVSYVISDVTTHQLPVMYYEGFFTYLYGASILFLLYVFCFLLQESTCCSGGKQPKAPKEKKPKKQKPKKPDPNEKAETAEAKPEEKAGKSSGKDKEKGGKPSPYQEVYPKKKRDLVRAQSSFQETQPEAEAAVSPRQRKRKTTQDAHGSFFLRVGAIAFGLGSLIYIGLEFGSFFEVPFDSPCHQILRGVNPLLQMIFTFMQMYFIFMNSRLNIHRFKVLARFGLMHVVATNICVWIRTLVLEAQKEITAYYLDRVNEPEENQFAENLRQHTLIHAGMTMGTELGPAPPDAEWISKPSRSLNMPGISAEDSPGHLLDRLIRSTISSNIPTTTLISTTTPASTTFLPTTTSTSFVETTTAARNFFQSGFNAINSGFNNLKDSILDTETTTPKPVVYERPVFSLGDSAESFSTSEPGFLDGFISTVANKLGSISDLRPDPTSNIDHEFESLNEKFNILPRAEAFRGLSTFPPFHLNATSCERNNILGTTVPDSTPYLYPFIIEYSLIGAVVIYVMWKHIGRYPKFSQDEDLEHRLEVMLSRRAVALAQSNSGRVDCVGASKGLFFGLLMLVGSMICLILFFVLVRHEQFRIMAYYLADASHGILMILAILAILIGFCRVTSLKFRCEESTNLNDILLRVSAFGLFLYSVFSVIAGALNAHKDDQNLLVTITSSIAIFQVILQLLFIADVSRRRVHLPEHDRTKPGRQIVTFLLICNISMIAIYTFEAQKVMANPVQKDFYGFITWALIQRVTLPLCIFHRFHSAVTLAEVWKTTYKARLE
ncbi:CLUMA_CG006518, isoform C [Clunio marinus]|uniref:CLUMA_CG006518, isoform C n=1 Tax=Clunio marinus TaxID=568069 RepID=A0A1J1I0K1_9DIPT|nr:CLUMA_CG006518, isoform C [Clunio marinus]